MMETKKRVLLTCPQMLPGETLNWLSGAVNLTAAGCALSENELGKAMEGADVVIIGGGEFFTLPVLKRAKLGLKAVFVGVQGDTSFSPEALEYLGKDNLLVTGGGLKEVALTTVAQIADPLMRKALITQRTRNFSWVAVSSLVEEFRPLSELDVSVIGAGGIGAMVLQSLQGRCKSLRYHNPRGEKKELAEIAVWEPDLKKAFETDFVALHLRLEKETERIIGYQHLERIKKGGWFLNPSRAGLVDEKDFLRYLRKGGRAIWDVFYKEGEGFKKLIGQNNVFAEIARMPGFFFTSHTAAVSLETIREYGEGLEKVMRERVLA